MIMQIRVDEPFTLPRQLKELTKKNLKILYPYFHKHIIDAEKKIHNTLNTSALLTDTKLQNLVNEMDKLLFNKPFEVFCFIPEEQQAAVAHTGLIIDTAQEFFMPYKPSAYPVPENHVLIKAIIRFQHFCDEDKPELIIELLKHFTYNLISEYYYPVQFTGSTRQSIKANRILEVITGMEKGL